MEEKNKERAILFLSVLLLITTSIVICAIFALFSIKSQELLHVKTGNLEVELIRDKIDSRVLNEEGIFEVTVSEDDIDLSKDGSGAFRIENAVPGSYYDCLYIAKNTGTTTFEATLDIADILVTRIDGGEVDPLALEKIKITIKYQDEEISFLLSEANGVNCSFDLGVILVGEGEEFSIVTELLATAENECQGLIIKYGIKLSCVQVIENK